MRTIKNKEETSLVKISSNTPESIKCWCCGVPFSHNMFYDSCSPLFGSVGKAPYCKRCIEALYNKYQDEYMKMGYDDSDRKAVERICMILDVYYNHDAFDAVVDKCQDKLGAGIIFHYMQRTKLRQYRNKNYGTTLSEKFNAVHIKETVCDVCEEQEEQEDKSDIKAAAAIFGDGFSDEDYIFLKTQYDDWTARHECNTKAQEEVFKDICFNRLQNLKALRKGEDTKDITASFQKMLDSGKLQPKQNSGDATADNQTFGTLIDKWENTRPLPEVDEELKDVDKIGLLINVFFKGHLAKMMGLKNAFSNLYTKYMKRYTVEKPEYEDDEDSEALFDAVFGGVDLDE